MCGGLMGCKAAGPPPWHYLWFPFNLFHTPHDCKCDRHNWNREGDCSCIQPGCGSGCGCGWSGGDEYDGCGCGEKYWGDHDSSCDLCDTCGNFVGRGCDPIVSYQQPPQVTGEYYSVARPGNANREMDYRMNARRTNGTTPLMANGQARKAQPAPQQYANARAGSAPQPVMAQQATQNQPAAKPMYSVVRKPNTFTARAGSRNDNEVPNNVATPVAHQRPQAPTMNMAQQANGTQTPERVSQANYEQPVRSSKAPMMKDPWAWMYVD